MPTAQSGGSVDAGEFHGPAGPAVPHDDLHVRTTQLQQLQEPLGSTLLYFLTDDDEHTTDPDDYQREKQVQHPLFRHRFPQPQVAYLQPSSNGGRNPFVSCARHRHLAVRDEVVEIAVADAASARFDEADPNPTRTALSTLLRYAMWNPSRLAACPRGRRAVGGSSTRTAWTGSATSLPRQAPW
ncbi:hypothetical protein PQF33_42660 [Dactylosporangium aurantiacum]|nr:hypothetical protein [Dactylosporangium aurantiacum]